MVTKNSIDSGIPIELSKGGTNATSFSTNTGIVKYDGTSLVTSTTALIDSSNRMTNTSQPTFLAYNDTARANVTGDGTLYNLVFEVEVFDQGNNYDATSTFTAPVTGRYYLSARTNFSGILNTHTVMQYDIITSNRGYMVQQSPYLSSDASGNYTAYISVLADMDAGDTAYVDLAVYNGTKVIDITTGTAASSFCGCLEF